MDFTLTDKEKWVQLNFKKKELFSDKIVDEEYYGEVKNGLPHGDGIYKTPYAVDTGEFRRGKLDGKGKLTRNGNYFEEGQYRNGQLDGYGKKTTNYVIEEGIWAKAVFQEGKVFIIKDKKTFEGKMFYGDYCFEAGFLGNYCKGKLTFENGDWVDGIFDLYFTILVGDKYNSEDKFIEFYSGREVNRIKTFFKKIFG